MDTNILVLVILAFVVALLVLLVKSGKGAALLQLFNVKISVVAGQEGERNVIRVSDNSTATSNLQMAPENDSGQNVIEATGGSEAEGNIQIIK